jgi:glycosyltransferase involved in cell wall biosynthesis
MGPLVSAVIPTYNYGRFVAEAVESALAQTYSPLEVIVVDDGSTDDTRERLAAFGDRIRYVYQPNQGLSAARNTGVREARGEWIAFLDSDDVWHPRRVELQMAHAACQPDAGLIAADSFSDSSRRWPAFDPHNIPATPVSMKEILIRSRFGPGGVLARRECFDLVGGFDTTLRSAEDRDMWLRIAARYPLVKLSAPLWWYRQHSGSMSSAAVRMEQNEMRVIRRMLDSSDGRREGRLLRRKSLGYTYKSAAVRYLMDGNAVQAMKRLAASVALWPLPFRPDERITRLERLKMAVRCVLKLTGLSRPTRLAPAA